MGGWAGTPIANQHNIFDSKEKNLSHIFLVLLTQAGFEPPTFGSGIQPALPSEPPRQQRRCPFSFLPVIDI